MRPFTILAIAAALATAGLVSLAPRMHPAREWGYRFDRDQAIALARAQANALGMATPGWSTYATQEAQQELAFYRRRHPEDAVARAFSPYTVHVIFASPDKRLSIAVQLCSDGRVSSWERKEAGALDWTMKSMRSAVDAAFHVIAGPDAGEYRPVTEGAATKDGLRFTWERNGVTAGFQPSIDLIVRDGTVVRAETQYSFGRQVEYDYSHRDDPMNWFILAYISMCFVLGLGAVILYTIGTIRRRVKQRFALLFCAVNVLSLALAFWLGPGLENARAAEFLRSPDVSVNKLLGFGYEIVIGILVALTVAGGGLFVAGELSGKWSSLRLLLSRRALSRQVGRSLAAGVLAAPLLTVVPLIAAAISSHAEWDIDSKAQIFSPHPLAGSGNDLLHPLVLMLFGVTLGLLWKVKTSHLVRMLVFAPLAVVLFAGLHDVIQAPTAAILISSGLLAAVQIWLFFQFDLLSITVAETGFVVLGLAVPALLQPAPGLQAIGWQALLLLSLVLSSGLLMLWKAPEAAAAGDPGPEALDLKSEREELKSEFLIAQRAQREMLPAVPPAIPGFTIAASCTPAREVGGDLYDFLPLPDNRLAIAVADVSGKGVPAALYMTLTKGLLAATTQDDLKLSTMLEQINAHLCTVGQRKTFVTMAIGILDPAARSLEYGRAGHNPVVWRRRSAGTTALLNTNGLGLGITAGRVFGRVLQLEKLELRSGDKLVFYSDGLTEAMNRDLEQFGEERLLQAVEKTDDLAAPAARDAILREVSQFLAGRPAQDDLTLVVLDVD